MFKKRKAKISERQFSKNEMISMYIDLFSRSKI